MEFGIKERIIRVFNKIFKKIYKFVFCIYHIKSRWLLLTWGFICSVIAFIPLYFFVYLKFKSAESTSSILSFSVGIDMIILISLVLGFIVSGIIVILSRKKEIK